MVQAKSALFLSAAQSSRMRINVYKLTLCPRSCAGNKLLFFRAAAAAAVIHRSYGAAGLEVYSLAGHTYFTRMRRGART